MSKRTPVTNPLIMKAFLTALTATLGNNSSAKALAALLENGPISVDGRVHTEKRTIGL